ncbi:hypothetical protein PQR15_09105 [Streptomyces lydicus]|nr:hypothetical protein [Streptomyces lydicus]
MQLTFRLAELVPMVTAPAAGPPVAQAEDGRRWAAQLLAGVLLRVPDAAPYTGVLRLLADRITERSLRAGGFAHTGLEMFGPWFWERLALADEDRMDLLRRLLPSDGPPAAARQPDRAAPPPATAPSPSRPGSASTRPRGGHHAADPTTSPPGGARPRRNPGPPRRHRAAPERFLDTAAGLLRAAPERIQPLLCSWFDDIRPLQRPAAPTTDPDRAVPAAPRELTVASAAQALLHTHRRRAPDALLDALVAAVHPKGDELLEALAEDEPAAVCRAVDRWAHDEDPVAASPPSPTGCGWPRTPPERPTARWCAKRPCVCSPGPRTRPTTAPRSPC